MRVKRIANSERMAFRLSRKLKRALFRSARLRKFSVSQYIRHLLRIGITNNREYDRHV